MGKVIVVGAGFSGSILARKIAEELNKQVILIEKRPHVGGNMYDETDEHGILVQKYGPHVLVTNEWKVISYLSKYSELFQHTVKELSVIDGQYVRLPFNFESIQQLIGYEKAETVINKLRKQFKEQDRVPVLDLCNCSDRDISDFGNLLFEKSFKTYCAKQWDVPTEQLDKTIMGRSAVAMGYDERYMNKDFQFLPTQGFTKLFENMLNHPNITVRLNCDALAHLHMDDSNEQILMDGEPVELLAYTGALDELFNEQYGDLPYRSLDIRYEWFDQEQVYPEKIISFPQAEGYTRRTEYKFMMKDYSNAEGTVIATEYPTQYVKDKSIAPFYPVITEETKERYTKYLDAARHYRNLFLCGRLAEFRYYNMDDCILHAFQVFDNIREYYMKKES